MFSAGAGVLPQQAQTLSTCPRPLSTVASSSSSSSSGHRSSCRGSSGGQRAQQRARAHTRASTPISAREHTHKRAHMLAALLQACARAYGCARARCGVCLRALWGVPARAVVCARARCCARCVRHYYHYNCYDDHCCCCCCWRQWTVDVATVDSGQSLSLLGRRPAPAGQTASLAEVSVNSLISPFKPARKPLHPA